MQSCSQRSRPLRPPVVPKSVPGKRSEKASDAKTDKVKATPVSWVITSHFVERDARRCGN